MYQCVKGTDDFYPAEKEVQNMVFDKLRCTAKSYGYLEVESPAFETLKLLTAKSGENIKEQLFLLKKRGSEELGLRFDLTVPMTRMFIEKQKDTVKPVKWFCLGRMWRYEAPQKGRQREFYQLGVECFGSDKPEADAEIINLMIDCFKAVGLTAKDFVIKINDRQLLESLLDFVPKNKLEDVFRLIDKSGKIGEKEFERELSRLKLDKKGITKIKRIIKIKGSPDKVLKALKGNAAEKLLRVTSKLPKEFIEIDLSIARGIAYYTGIVFEAFARDVELRALAGGGRYDNLIKLLRGQDCPATGFAIGYSTLLLLLKEKNKMPKAELEPDYYIAVVDEKFSNYANEIAQKLRKKYSVAVDLMQRKLGKQLEYANAIRAKKVIVIGEKEVKEKKLTVRDMRSGKEGRVRVEELVVENVGKTTEKEGKSI